jgi:soluble lytic murein transglycosylase-like protein
MPVLPTRRLVAAAAGCLALMPLPALAESRPPANPVAAYSTVLRTLNPHLPEWQSRKYATSVLANAMRTHVDPRFIMAIVTVESDWQKDAVSRVGARGLGQLMPHTAADLHVNARDAADNLRGTASYLRSLLDRFRGQQNSLVKTIAGYNAGPNAVKKFGGIPPFAETQHYVSKVLRVYNDLHARVGVAWSPYGSHRQLARRAAAVNPNASALSDAARADDEFVQIPIPPFPDQPIR